MPGHNVDDIELAELNVEWVPRETLEPNDYNPNVMTHDERLLLRQSVLEDGWTQPIVTLANNIIIDGEQRWQVSGMPVTVEDIQGTIDKMHKRQEDGADVSGSILAHLEYSRARIAEVGEDAIVADITGGLVPRTILNLGDRAHMMISTIRHNRARGQHRLREMATITQHLQALGLDKNDLQIRIGMTTEEIGRFLRMSSNIAPTPAAVSMTINDISGDEQVHAAFKRSVAAAPKAYQLEVAERDAAITNAAEVKISQVEEDTERALTQSEKDDIRKQIAADTPRPAPPQQDRIIRLLILLTLENNALFDEMLGDRPVAQIDRYCRFALSNQDKMDEWRQSDE